MDRPIFSDRTSAGDFLARKILETGKTFDVVLGLARGGVPVAVPVAKTLRVPLFPMIARKIGAPWEKELALGALSENGGLYWNRELIESMDINPEAMQRLVDKARKEIREKVSRLRSGKSLPALSGKRIVLVDDGAATGATNFAAITDILAEEPEHLVVAVPVAPPEFEKKVRRMGAEPLVLHSPADFRAVGEWYERFPEVTDGEVLLVLGNLSRPGKAEGGRRFDFSVE
uniref:Phosphoribosyltransferase n=1 Tax=Leptospirillum ferriphilum TaxID=178606 RepID=A0A7C3QSQ9_9BACT